MKKGLVTVLTMLAVFVAGSLAVPQVQAQDAAKPVSFRVGAGAAIPAGGLFGDFYNLGFHGAANVSFNVAPKLDVLAGGEFHYFPIDKQGVSGVKGGTYTTFNLGGDLKLNLGAPGMSSNPYVLGGVGFAIQNISDLTVPGFGTAQGGSETDFFFEFGAGVEFSKFFVQAKFVDVLVEGEAFKFIPFTIGAKF